jgi:hypothetical protein
MNKIFSTLDNPRVKEKIKEEKDKTQILGNFIYKKQIISKKI